jgi:uncharacterized protein YndB with AHSA1/START domain
MSQRFDSVKVTVTVAADPATAFEVFTVETDLWWRRGFRFRIAGNRPGVLTFEPRLGGRLLETFETPAGARVAVTGRITAWDPPAHFAFDWRAANFADEDPSTTVEVWFEAVASGTRVTLEHRGFAALRKDHPALHGLGGSGYIRMYGLWWGDLMTSLRERIAGG